MRCYKPKHDLFNDFLMDADDRFDTMCLAVPKLELIRPEYDGREDYIKHSQGAGEA